MNGAREGNGRKMNAADTSIQEAETAFVRRKFARSLRIANSILEQASACVEEGEKKNASDADGESSSSSGEDDGPKVFPYADGVSTTHFERDGGDDIDVVCLQTPLIPHQTSGTTSKGPDARSQLNTNNPWRIRLSNNLSVHDRAAAIIIQSIFEMDNSHTSGIAKDSASVVTRAVAAQEADERNQCIVSNLDPFCRYYRHNAMPIDLACIYIPFCAAIGWADVAVTSSVKLLAEILHRRQDLMMAKELCNTSWFLDKCEELLYLVLTDLLPRVKHITDCKMLYCQVLEYREESKPASFTGPIEMSEEIHLTSVEFILDNLDRLIKRLDPCFSDVLEECAEKLQEMYDKLKEDEQVVAAPSSSKDDTISSVAERITGRSTAPDTNSADIDDSSSSSPSIVDLIQNNIVEPIWESEDRWTNRATVAAVGVTSLLLWRRRRQLGAASRSAGHTLLAPVREVVEALLQADK